MKVLVIGGGGREHALVWKLKQSPSVEKIWCAPGNAGITEEAECLPVDPAMFRYRRFGGKSPAGSDRHRSRIASRQRRRRRLQLQEMADRGPNATSRTVGGQQNFLQGILLAHNIPTAKMYGTFDSAEEAYAALKFVPWPLVIKADGLCAGKGVFLAPDEPLARAFISALLEKKELGAGGSRILFEETLHGEELSFIILTDGQRYASLVPTRDHKRAFDGNLGPNTGGMGAYSTDDLYPAISPRNNRFKNRRANPPRARRRRHPLPRLSLFRTDADIFWPASP